MQQAAAADAADARRLKQEGTGPPAPVHVTFDEPVIHSAQRSQQSMTIFNRSRHFFDRFAAQRRLKQAELVAERSRYDHGLVDGVAWPSPADRDPLAWVRP